MFGTVCYAVSGDELSLVTGERIVVQMGSFFTNVNFLYKREIHVLLWGRKGENRELLCLMFLNCLQLRMILMQLILYQNNPLVRAIFWGGYSDILHNPVVFLNTMDHHSKKNKNKKHPKQTGNRIIKGLCVIAKIVLWSGCVCILGHM